MTGSAASAQVERALARWPELVLPGHVQEAATRAFASRTVPCPEDLVLAMATAAGARAAIAILERVMLAAADSHLRANGYDDTTVGESIQRTREKLLVGKPPTIPPAIEAYQGEGSLTSYVRVIAIHTAVSLRRADKSPLAVQQAEHCVELADLLCAAADAEHQLVQAESAIAIKQVVSGILRQLSPRERALLRFHFMDGLNIDQIASIYGTHRATAATWLSKARQKLAAQVRHQLATLGTSGTGLSLSQIELGLSGILGGA
jgi:RNA polymerase sigma-70 factor (ECF subfamily)